VELETVVGPGLPSPKDGLTSTIQNSQSRGVGRPRVMLGDAIRLEYVRRANLGLFHDVGPFASLPAKKLNLE